jgi:hypothetical protein
VPSKCRISSGLEPEGRPVIGIGSTRVHPYVHRPRCLRVAVRR